MVNAAFPIFFNAETIFVISFEIKQVSREDFVSKVRVVSKL